MESYVLFAWIASFLFGIEGVLGKLTSKHAIKNPWLFNFAWNGIIMLLTIPIALINHVGMPTAWGNIIIAALFYALSGVFYTWAIYLLDISVLSPLFNFRTVFSVLLGVWLLHQLLTTQQYILIGVIFLAGLFVSFDEHFKLRSFFRIPILIAMIEMVIVAFFGVYTNKALAQNGFWETTLWTQILGQGMLALTWTKFGTDLRKISKVQIGSLSIMSVAGTIGMIAVNKAYAGNVGIAATIISLPFSMVIAFLFALFAPTLLEKHTMKTYAIRFIAAGVMLVAAIKLTV
jgi:drug/metabolite transporter (DMT)-like permease